MPVNISNPDPRLFKDITAFISNCDMLEKHEPHFYKIILDYHGDTSLVAISDLGKVCGWTFGIVSQRDPGLFFLWQIGVASEKRREGIGLALIEKLMMCARRKNCTRIRATVEASNYASRQLFEKASFKNVSSNFSNAVGGVDGGFVSDFYGEGEDMIVFERPI